MQDRYNLILKLQDPCRIWMRQHHLYPFFRVALGILLSQVVLQVSALMLPAQCLENLWWQLLQPLMQLMHSRQLRVWLHS
jgi:hypothetical protein